MAESPDNYSWQVNEKIPFPPIRLSDAFRGVLRGVSFLIITLLFAVIFFLAKTQARFSNFNSLHKIIRRNWSLIGLWFCGVKLEIKGDILSEPGAIAANHISWLDILALQGAADLVFVAKSEVRGWFGLGHLARLANTLFVKRKRLDAKLQQFEILKRLKSNDRICFFPEGTSTDGLRVLHFKSSLFSVFFTKEKVGSSAYKVQPVTLSYLPSKLVGQSFYGWWGDSNFFTHLVKVLCLSKGGTVKVFFHPPLTSGNFTSRKEMSARVEKLVRTQLLLELKP